jgi:uncharacterized membrane protein
MALDTFVVIAGRYDSEQDALDDYDAVRKLYTELGIIDTYDAAVLTRDEGGKVHIVKRVEEPTRQGSVGGLTVGVAVGALVALFPAVALGAGIVGGAALGAGAGAIAGHVVGGMSRKDLKELGELLDEGTSGLVVVAAADYERRVEEEIKRAKKRAKAQLDAQVADLKAAIDAV